MNDEHRTDHPDSPGDGYRSIFHASPIGKILSIEGGGRIVDVNEAFCRMFGFERADLVGQPAEGMGIWSHPAERVRFLEAYARGGQVHGFEAAMTTRSGTPKHVEIYSSRIRFQGEDCIVSHLIDVTEAVRLKKTLIENDIKIRKAQEIAGYGSYMTDLKTGNWESSDVLDAIFGIDDNFEHTIPNWNSLLHPDFREPALQHYLDVIRERKDFRMDYQIIRPRDGALRWVAANGEIEYDSAGEPLRLIGTIQDITDRKLAEQARDALQAQLREAQKMEAIGTLAGGIAHDFNNIIANILGNADLASEDVAAGNSAARQSLDEITKAALRGRDLVQQILSFSRRRPTARKVTDLSLAVAESARLLRATLPARIDLQVHCDARAPRVLADATQIEQVLINLATNSMQAMRNTVGRIELRLDAALLEATADESPALKALRERQSGPVVRLSVSDTGPGMSRDVLSRIFEPFFTTKPQGEGTGLGLSVALGIAQSHEGVLQVQSEEGKGAVFTLYLPPAPADAVSREEAVPPANPVKSMGNGQRILYLDDDDSLVLLVTRLLARRGFLVSGFTDQEEALRFLHANPQAFDLVLTDYNMPRMSGLDVAREVRALNPNLKVVVTSGFIDENLRANASGAGVDELLFKASAVDDLCASIARLAEQARVSH